MLKRFFGRLAVLGILAALPIGSHAMSPDDYYTTQDFGYNYIEGMTRLSIIIAAILFIAAFLIIQFKLSDKARQSGIFVFAVAITSLAYIFDVEWYICFWLPVPYLVYVMISLWREPSLAQRRQRFLDSMTDKNEDARPVSKVVFWICMLTAQLGAFAGFAELGDLTQMWIQSPRWLTMWVFTWRWPIFFFSFAALGASILVWNWDKVVQKRWVIALSVLMLFNVTTWFVPGRMFQTKVHDAQFVGFDVTDEVLFDRTELTVIEIDGEAVGYPDPFIVQAHATGTEIAGQKVAMTHCGLTHLSFAYEPIIDGKEVDLKVFTQLANNLVLYDTKTDEPIQQISGIGEYSGKAMKSLPSFRMSYGSYKNLFPNGKVFWYPIVDFWENPAEHLWNSWVRWIIYMLVNEQHANPTEASFPTVHWDDRRLPAKELIYGLRGLQNQEAYTKDYVIEEGDIKAIIDDREVRLIHFPEYESIMAFYSDGYSGPIDVHGLTPDGRELERYEGLISEAFWMIWVYFYPESTAHQL